MYEPNDDEDNDGDLNSGQTDSNGQSNGQPYHHFQEHADLYRTMDSEGRN